MRTWTDPGGEVAPQRSEGLGILVRNARQAVPFGGEPDESSAAPTTAGVRTQASGVGEQAPPPLPFARQKAGRTQDHEHAAALIQAARGPTPCAATTIPPSCIYPSAAPASPRTTTRPARRPRRRTVGHRTVTDDCQPWRVQVGGELRAGATFDFDHGIPLARQPRDEEPLTLGAHQADLPLSRIEVPDQFRVDPLVVTDLGNRHDRDRPIGGGMCH